MLEVKGLSKRYGSHMAVSDLTFTVEKGQIYGFLGPNGAGKSTTMNIIAGCLAATEGTVAINGHDIFEQPVEAKKCIGYLPEIPPLYPDMTPYEYLTFAAKAKGVEKAKVKTQVEAAIEKTGLKEMQDRLIKHLSKGYKQRVGIAMALLGDPALIILDEPTVGLDPKQIIEIRNLILSLKGEHTVILSSHILSEVQEICDQILIISHGKMVANDSAENLETIFRGKITVELRAACDSERFFSIVHTVPGVTNVVGQEEGNKKATSGTVTLSNEVNQDEICEALFFAFAKKEIPLLRMNLTRASLEDVFLELTSEAHEEEIKRAEAEKEEKKRLEERKEPIEYDTLGLKIESDGEEDNR